MMFINLYVAGYLLTIPLIMVCNLLKYLIANDFVDLTQNTMAFINNATIFILIFYTLFISFKFTKYSMPDFVQFKRGNPHNQRGLSTFYVITTKVFCISSFISVAIHFAIIYGLTTLTVQLVKLN